MQPEIIALYIATIIIIASHCRCYVTGIVTCLHACSHTHLHSMLDACIVTHC